jgi:hypothetical protein
LSTTTAGSYEVMVYDAALTSAGLNKSLLDGEVNGRTITAHTSFRVSACLSALFTLSWGVFPCIEKTKQYSQPRGRSPDNTTSTKTPPIRAYKYRHTPIASPGQHHDDANNCGPQPGPSMLRAGSTFPHWTCPWRHFPPHPDEGGAEAHAEEVCVWIGARSESWHRHRRTPPCGEAEGAPPQAGAWAGANKQNCSRGCGPCSMYRGSMC